MSINLSRNTRLWVSTVDKDGTHTNANTFEIPVQEGYTLTQSVTSSDVNIEEAGPVPTRGSARFNDQLDPVDWSFTTYNTPYFATNHYTVDMLMWHALASSRATAVDLDNTTTTSKVYGDANSFKVSFANNAAHVLTPIYLYFKIDNTVYYINNCQVGQAEITVDIADISQTVWSGQGLTYNSIPAPAFIAAGGAPFDPDSVTPGYVAIAANKDYIVNKLTLMDVNADVAPTANDYYNIPITGATITINNNVTYLTPTTLAEVNTPIGSFTGSFEVTGSFDAFLRETGGDGTTGTPYGSYELLTHMLANVQGAVSNASNIVLYVGGKVAGDQQVVITIPRAHLAVPEVNVEDVVGVSVEFKGMPSSTDLQSGDEIAIEFKAKV